MANIFINLIRWKRGFGIFLIDTVLVFLFLKKKMSLLTNTRNKVVIWKINFYFWTSRKMAIFFLKMFLILNMITDSFLVKKWGTLEHARRYVCKNLLNLDCQDSIWFAFFKLLKNEVSFGKSFSFPFSARYFEKISNVSYLVFCRFLMSWMLKIQNTLKDIFSITFFMHN